MIDYTIDDVINIPFTTRAFATGIPTVLAGSQTVEIYEDASTSPIVEGAGKLVLTISLNSVAGFNIATVTLSSANGFEAGKHYTLIIKTGTVDSVSVVGEVVGEFTIGFHSATVDLANGTDGLGAIKAETALIVADTNELQTDNIPGLIATAQADLDTITGSDGATLATAQGLYAPSKAGDAMTLTAAATSAQLVDDIWDELLAGHVTVDSAGLVLNEWQDAGRLDVILDAIKAVTDNLPESGALTTIGTDTARLTAARAGALTDWIDGQRLDLLLDAIPTTAMRGTDSGALASVCTEARLSELDAVTGGKMANQVDVIETDTTSLNDTKIPDTISLANIQGEVDTALGTYDSPTRSEATSDKDEIMVRLGFAGVGLTAITDVSAPTATEIVDEWETQSQSDPTGFHVNVLEVNGTGQTANDIGADTNTLISRQDPSILIGNAGVGLTHLAESSICTDTRLGELDSANMPTDLDNALADTTSLNDTKIPDTISLANINAEVDTALITTTYAEPGQGAPSATASINDKLSYMYKFARNKITNDGNNVKVWDDAGTTIDQLSPVTSVGGTVTRGEFISG